MSNPSGNILVQQVIDNPSLPLAIRLQAIRDPSYRPTLSFLLRLIRDPSTPAGLRAHAAIRYNQETELREVTRAKREGSTKAEKLTEDSPS